MKNLSILQQLQEVKIECSPTQEETSTTSSLEMQVYVLEDAHCSHKIGVLVENTEAFDEMIAQTDVENILERLSEFDAVLLDI